MLDFIQIYSDKTFLLANYKFTKKSPHLPWLTLDILEERKTVVFKIVTKLPTVHAPYPLLILNRGFKEEFLCLLHRLSVILTALDYKPQ